MLGIISFVAEDGCNILNEGMCGVRNSYLLDRVYLLILWFTSGKNIFFSYVVVSYMIRPTYSKTNLFYIN